MPVITVVSRWRGRALRGDSGAWEQCCGQLLGRMSPQEATPFLARAVLRKDNSLKASIAPQSAAQRGTENDKITGKKASIVQKKTFKFQFLPIVNDTIWERFDRCEQFGTDTVLHIVHRIEYTPPTSRENFMLRRIWQCDKFGATPAVKCKHRVRRKNI